jgi:hypothetical protein
VSLAGNSLHISAPRQRLATFSSSPLALLAASSSVLRCIHPATNLCTEFLVRHASHFPAPTSCGGCTTPSCRPSYQPRDSLRHSVVTRALCRVLQEADRPLRLCERQVPGPLIDPTGQTDARDSLMWSPACGVAVTPVRCRACWSLLHPWIVRGVGIHGRTPRVRCSQSRTPATSSLRSWSPRSSSRFSAAPNAYAPTTPASAWAWQSSKASRRHTTEPSPSPPAGPAGSASQCNYQPLLGEDLHRARPSLLADRMIRRTVRFWAERGKSLVKWPTMR